jgi:hypothetical protein
MSEDRVRVQQSSIATRGVAADVELSTEPSRLYATRLSPQTYLDQVVVQATAADSGEFTEPRLVLVGIDRLTRADWEKLDRAARQLFDEYDRAFGEAATSLTAPNKTIVLPVDERSVTVRLPGILLLSEKEISARSLRPVLDRLLDRVGARYVSVVVTSDEPL